MTTTETDIRRDERQNCAAEIRAMLREKTGHEWVNNSLWHTIINRAAAVIDIKPYNLGDRVRCLVAGFGTGDDDQEHDIPVNALGTVTAVQRLSADDRWSVCVDYPDHFNVYQYYDGPELTSHIQPASTDTQPHE
jgi:hypothetical protein